MGMWDVKTYEVCVRMSPSNGGALSLKEEGAK